MKRWTSRYWDHPALDWVFTVVGLLALGAKFPDETAFDFQMGIATVAGITVGISAIVFAIYSQSSGNRMRYLRRQKGSATRNNWLAIMRGMVVACFLALFAMALNGSSPTLAIGLSGVAGVLLLARTLRMVYFLGKYMEIQALDEGESISPSVRNDL